jgi:L-ascorbate metabolism protein UlaG (beta-lactamase superfamily)
MAPVVKIHSNQRNPHFQEKYQPEEVNPMRLSTVACLLTAITLAAFLAPAAVFAQHEDEDFDSPYSDAPQDIDEIIETDDALTEEAREAKMKMEIETLLEGIKWLGHAAFLIEDEIVIYIDPFELPEGLPGADLILITHEHRDHLSPGDMLKVLRPNTKVVTVEAAESYLPEEAREVVAVVPGESIEVDGIGIEVIPAYNKTKDFHPKDRGYAGYVIHLKDRTVYHAGDTDFIDEMKNIEADIALLPAGGTYTMDAGEAAKAANAIKPRVAIPMHWGKIVGSREDAETFVAECDVPAIIMEVYVPETQPESEQK